MSAQTGSELTGSLSSTLDEVNASMNQVGELIDEIARKTVEHAHQIQTVDDTVERITDIVQ